MRVTFSGRPFIAEHTVFVLWGGSKKLLNDRVQAAPKRSRNE